MLLAMIPPSFRRRKKKERKALKVQEKETNQAPNEATKSIADEFHAQQASKQANDEAEMPRKKSKGRVSITDIL